MTAIQRFILGLTPKSWRPKMIADSYAWHYVCPCGSERSVWDAGGIRAWAAGSPRRWTRCPKCGQRTWQRLEKREAVAPPAPS
jgi:hypothetical protein